MAQMTVTLLNAWLSYCLGRQTDYALQQEDGRYLRQGMPLTTAVVMQHLRGELTIGTYVMDEYGSCRFAVFDSDTADGLLILATLQTSLVGLGVITYLEHSRRGAHLWVFFEQPLPAFQVRHFLLPFCPAGVEFYPKQDRLTADRPFGSIIRLPFGVHRLSGVRYPFVGLVDGVPVPLASSLLEQLALFPSFQRVPVSRVPTVEALSAHAGASTQADIPFNNFDPPSNVGYPSIRDWCWSLDPLSMIGRYVALDQKGMGCCPFGWHHPGDGVDSHPSLYVYRPTYPDVRCWYCHTWQAGGSLFDFLRYYYGLEARELWSRILSGAHV
jgi:hypothetical protein